MLNTETLALDAVTLAASLTGDVVAPGDREYDLARRAWNLAVDQRPALVAFPADAIDVVAIVDFARARGLRVAPQGTGHNAAPLPDLGDVVLLSTQRMRGVSIDAEARIARVEAGTLWIEVTEETSKLGLAPLSGSSPDVGVVGYTLGGGLSWLARKHGLAANSVTAVELVTADGRFVRATADQEADLFWAVRGGGGNLGIVTALEFRLYVAPAVYAGMLLWPAERAGEVLRAWREWTTAVPDEATTSARIMHFPPLPELPEFVQGRSVVVIDGAILGPHDEAEALLAPLRALEPELDTFGLIPPVGLSRIHMDPEEPIPYVGSGALLDPIDDAAIDAWVTAAGAGSGTALLFTEIRHLGGAVGRVPEGAGVAAKMHGDYLSFGGGLALSPDMGAAVEASLERFDEALAPWASGANYLNFSEKPVDPATFYRPEDHRRLREIRAAVDPDGIIVANHRV
ncbi:MAG TPA: FAD-binding oxidoreductase [Solirubrobacteraceae bacterium]|nr:FAD-binding oxidoreductase [Solirubrobacteraceae bacterium]